MTTLYEWLKKNRNVRFNTKEVKSLKIKGTINYNAKIKSEPLVVSKKESEMLVKIERYLNIFPQVSDEMFNEMLQDKHLVNYKNLLEFYNPTDGGIASDFRNHGWLAVAKYIAFKKNQNAKLNNIEARENF